MEDKKSAAPAAAKAPAPQMVVVTNVSKGPLTLAAAGYAKIMIEAGKTHTFENMKAYLYYQKSAQGLKDAGMVELQIGDKVEKQEKTPAVDEQQRKAAEAAAKSQMAPPPAAPEADDDEEEGDAKPAAKGIAANKKK